ncbi:MAG: hypothetical protein WCM93_11645 [Bacteroidota bacterium]
MATIITIAGMVATRKIIRSGILVFFILTQPLLSFSQASFLSRKITLDLPNCSLDVALREIGKAGRFNFSYDTDLIPVDRRVSLKANNAPVSELLNEILEKKVRPVEVGNHVILIRNRSDAHEKQSFPNILIKGTILDARTRVPLTDATVYEVGNKRSALSAENGNYKLVIPTGKKIRSITYCKSGYVDSVIFIKQASEYQINILLRPIQEGFSRLNALSGLVVVNSIDSLKLVSWLVPRMTKVNAQNLEIRTSRMVQLSIVPNIGINWKVTSSITNRFSLNLLAGYTGGLKGFELGGLLNITRREMNGFQFGGLGNIIGEKGRGLQIGGLCNFNQGKYNGVQFAGLFNYVPDTVRGAQISCGANIAAGYCAGWQISGVLNLSLKDVRKLQLSGLVNYGYDNNGIQLAGLLNIAKNRNNGVQLAVFFNYAKIVNGLQIGLINISKSADRGIPVGLFSYVKKGYHFLEISGNEIFYANTAFKSGTRNFYNIAQFGIGRDNKYLLSYGIGTIFTLNKEMSINIDASAGLAYHPTDTIYHGLLLKLNPALEYRFSKHFAIFGGPALNYFLFTKGTPSATPRGLSTYDFYFKSTQNSSIQMWIGGVLGVRF